MRSLIVVRGGDKSLHMQWWCKPEDRTYDIALSYFGDNTEYWKDKCDYFHPCKGSNWEGLSDFVNKNWELINKYDYVWFPDDDLWMHQKDLECYLELCREQGFVISQPALMKGSFYSWEITLQNRFTEYRETDFVEVMAPCFKVEDFNLFAATFSENTSGWGLEWLWWKIAKEHLRNKFAIVDKVAMLHTREVGVANSGGAKKSPHQELNELLEKYGLVKSAPRNLMLKKNILLLIEQILPIKPIKKYCHRHLRKGIYSSKRSM